MATKTVPHVVEFLSYGTIGGIQGKLILEKYWIYILHVIFILFGLDFKQFWRLCYIHFYKGEVKGLYAGTVNANAKTIQVLCLPLMVILYALGNPSVDYFSFDVEGAEVDVLNTIPWDKVDIKVKIQFYKY